MDRNNPWFTRKYLRKSFLFVLTGDKKAISINPNIYIYIFKLRCSFQVASEASTLSDLSGDSVVSVISEYEDEDKENIGEMGRIGMDDERWDEKLERFSHVSNQLIKKFFFVFYYRTLGDGKIIVHFRVTTVWMSFSMMIARCSVRKKEKMVRMWNAGIFLLAQNAAL